MLPTSIERRIAAWRASLSPTANPARFTQRLRYLGWSESETHQRLDESSEQLFETPPCVEGQNLLRRALDRLESAGLSDPHTTIPFGEVFSCFAEVAAAGICEPSSPLCVELTKTLGETSAPALLAELSGGAPSLLPPRSGPYRQFARNLQAGGLRLLLGKLPVLARDLALQMQHWRESTGEFFQRLEADRETLGKSFPGASGEIGAIEGQLGDLHRSGRRVMSVAFAGGRKLIYKPRGLQMDVAWHALTEWLRSREPGCTLRAPFALDRGEYGWVEYVEAASPSVPADYYRSAGELLALAWICGGSDFHEENVIATASGPVLIDLETLFTPVARPFGATDDELAAAGDEQGFGTSVISTMLLPIWRVDEHGHATDLSGFAGSQRDAACWAEPQWVDLATDRMRQELRSAPGKQPKNIPRDADGRLIPAAAFAEEMSEGFSRTVRALRNARAEIPLSPFRSAQIRFLVRNTQVYEQMRRRVLRPEFLKSAVDRSIELEKLSRPFFPPDMEASMPEVFKCYEAERCGLENGDIPSFHAANDETTLHGDGGIEIRGYFWKTGWEIALKRLDRLNEAIIAEQAAFVRASLRLRQIESPGTPSPSKEVSWIEAATKIAENIAKRAIPLHQGGISWLALGFDPVRKVQTPGLMGLDLYSGSLGVAIFLTALAKKTGEERWERLARECTRPRLDEMRQPRMVPFLTRMPLGIGSGLGSLVYGCQLLGQFLGDESYLADAQFFAGLIRGRDGKMDPVNDVLGGGAGAVVALTNLYQVTADGALLETAHKLGNAILSQRTVAPTGHRVWKPDFANQALTGLGHGAAGFAWALQRLSNGVREERFADAAREAIDYERAVFDAEAGNWPDFRRGAAKADAKAFMNGWCAGQPGIGLARLASDDAEAKKEVDVAIADAIGNPSLQALHLCCGQGARIELLLEAARIRRNPALREHAEAQATRMIHTRDSLGYYPLNGADHGRLFAPSFFQGQAGIGYTLLRLADETLPAVSTFQCAGNE